MPPHIVNSVLQLDELSAYVLKVIAEVVKKYLLMTLRGV
jgi:hypothetical protein